MKSAVAGVAGAVRIYQLTNNDLRKAENHGKRLDATSKARAVYDVPPVTITGLELRALFQAHIKGAFVPKAKAKAMHVIVQFPKKLVDGENAEYMLHHARRFCERVFGPDAIFADRVDRDERGRHVVDLFVAPKYIKQTKHQSKLAVTMSRHLKNLAVEYGKGPTPRGSALALQDALFEYFRDAMGLEGVKRGAPKLIAGPDWTSAEQLRDEELTEKEQAAQDRRRELNAREIAVTNMEACARTSRRAAEEERAETTRLRDKAAGDAAAAAAARESAEAAKVNADLKSQEAKARVEAARRQEEEQSARLDDMRRHADQACVEAEAAQAEARKARAERSKAELEALAARTKAGEDQSAASRARRDAENTRAAADSLFASAMADKRKLDKERSVHIAQLALLARASDDQSGLDLRTSATTFNLKSSRMTPEESAAYRSPWSAGLIIIARTLAAALEGIRAIKNRLAVRETELEKQKRDADARDASMRADQERHARDVEGHHAALALLDQQRADVTEKERRAEVALASAQGKVDKAAAAEAAARAALRTHQRWVTVVNELRPFPDGTRVIGDRIVANPSVATKLTPPTAAFIKSPAPEWARAVVADRFASAQEQQKAQSAAAALDTMLGEARTVLSPVQKQTIAQARHVMRQHGFGDPGMGF